MALPCWSPGASCFFTVIPGEAITIHLDLEHPEIGKFTRELIASVENHPNISRYLETEIASVAGHVGHFKPILIRESPLWKQGDGDRILGETPKPQGEKVVIDCGIVIVTTGANRAETTDFLHGQTSAVMTQVELGKRLAEKSFTANGKNIVMIQCVGSRQDRCEVSADRQCAWQLIYQRLKSLGQLGRLKKIAPPKNWNPSLAGGYRTIIREDHRI